MQLQTNSKRSWLILAAGVCLVYFICAGTMPLVGPDEPRYTQVAREMFERRDFVTPTLNGETWFEKPALLYWLMMVSFAVFGVNEWAARLPSALAGVLTIAAIVWVAQRIEREGGEGWQRGTFATAAIAASSLGLLVFARGASFDIIVTAVIAWTLACFFAAEIAMRANERRRALVGMYVAAGVGLLAKGLVGVVIPCFVIALYFLLRRRLPLRAMWSSLLWGVPLSLLVAGAWYAPVTREHGWTFLNEFFVQHHFARYTSNKYRHPQPFYFYLWVTPLLALPWTFLLAAALKGMRSWEWRADDAVGKLRVFAFAWLAAPVIFFSASGSKLPGYVLPALPGAILLVSGWLARRDMHAADKIYRRVAAVAGATMLAVLLAVVFAAEPLGERQSVRGLLREAARRGYGAERIYNLHTIERTAEFYAAGRLAYDATGEPLKLEGASEVVAAARRHGGAVLVIVLREHTHQLTDNSELSAEVIGDNGEVALVRAVLVRRSE